MGASFSEQSILNSPYEAPRLHHALDGEGQPLDAPPVAGRRPSELLTPVLKPRKKSSKDRGPSMFPDEEQEYSSTWVINEILSLVEGWRSLPNPSDGGSRRPRSDCSAARFATQRAKFTFEGQAPHERSRD